MTTLADLDLARPTLHEMLAPTLGQPSTRHRTWVMTPRGTIAVLPLGGALSADELWNACLLHMALERGVLVVV